MAKKKNRSKLLALASPDRHYPSDGPGSLRDRKDKDYDRYPSDREFPSGTFPMAKKKKKKKSRIA